MNAKKSFGQLVRDHKWLILMELVILFLCWIIDKTFYLNTYYMNKMVYFLTIMGMILVALVWFLWAKRDIAIHKLFAIVGLFIGIMYMVMIPAYDTPDEPLHFYKAYQESNALFGIHDSEDGYVPLRTDDANREPKNKYTNYLEYEHYYEEMIIQLKSNIIIDNATMKDTDYEAFPGQNGGAETQLYPYWPSVIAISLARVLKLNTAPLYLAGRLANLLGFLIIFTLAIKKTPVAKVGFFGMGILPIVSQQAISFAQDWLIMSLSALIVALMLRFWYEEDWKIHEMVILAVAGGLLCPLKHYTYFLISFLPLMLVIRALKQRDRASLKRSALIFGGVILLFAVIVIIDKMLADPSAETTASLFGKHIIGWADTEGWDMNTLITETLNPKRFLLFHIFAETFVRYAGTYWIQSMSAGLGNMNISVPTFFSFVWILLFALMFAKRKDQKVEVKGRVRAFMIIITLLLIAVILAGLLFGWTPAVYEFIVGVQGRYFVPVLPLIMLAMQSDMLVIDEEYDKGIVMFSVFHAVVLILGIFAGFVVATN